MKRLIALIMALAVTLGLTGCGGRGNQQLGDGDDVILSFALYDLGYGTQWLDESCDRFMDLMKDKSYPGGKTGVFCSIEKGPTPKADELASSGVHVVFDMGARDGSNSGNLLLLSADGKNALTGADEAEQAHHGQSGHHPPAPGRCCAGHGSDGCHPARRCADPECGAFCGADLRTGGSCADEAFPAGCRRNPPRGPYFCPPAQCPQDPIRKHPAVFRRVFFHIP